MVRPTPGRNNAVARADRDEQLAVIVNELVDVLQPERQPAVTVRLARQVSGGVAFAVGRVLMTHRLAETDLGRRPFCSHGNPPDKVDNGPKTGQTAKQLHSTN
jgi:hypothetical protein